MVFEIVIHGRGGQGAKTAAQLIVEAAIEKGKHIQAFPEYGPERSGAPMRTFARISDMPIRTHQPVTEPDVVLVIDPTLLESVDVNSGTNGKSILIVNSKENPGDVKEQTGFKGKVCTVDATGISIEIFGKNVPNTPMLGAFVRVTEVIGLEALLRNMEQMFIKKIGPEKAKANMECVKRAYKEVKA